MLLDFLNTVKLIARKNFGIIVSLNLAHIFDGWLDLLRAIRDGETLNKGYLFL